MNFKTRCPITWKLRFIITCWSDFSFRVPLLLVSRSSLTCPACTLPCRWVLATPGRNRTLWSETAGRIAGWPWWRRKSAKIRWNYSRVQKIICLDIFYFIRLKDIKLIRFIFSAWRNTIYNTNKDTIVRFINIYFFLFYYQCSLKT